MFASTAQWYQSTATPAANVLKMSSMRGKIVLYQLINCTKSFRLLLDSSVGDLLVQWTPVYRYMYACSLSAKYALQYIVQYVALIRYLSSSLHNLLLLNKEAHSTCAYDNVTLYAEHCSVIVRCVTRLPAKSRQSFAKLSIRINRSDKKVNSTQL